MNRAKEQWSNIVGKVGIGKLVGCGCLGCLVPLLSMGVFLVAVGWWLFGSGGNGSNVEVRNAIRYPAQSAVGPVSVQGQRASAQPTPVYAPSNVQGGIRHPEIPSAMGNQPGYLAEGPAAYKPYEGDNSLANKSWYLAQSNWTGQRRTPYVKGQTLSNGLTVVTGDFDFVLLQDASGVQWFCDPTGTQCQFWR